MSRINRILSSIFSIILVLGVAFLIFQIVNLNVLPMNFLILTIIVLVLITVILLMLLNFYGKHMVSKVFMLIITLVIAVSSLFGGFYLMKTANMFYTITKDHDTIKQTVSVIVNASSPYDKIQDIQAKKVAYLASSGPQGVSKCLSDIESKGILIETQEFEGISAMVLALENNEIDAMVINESVRGNITDIEEHKDFDAKTRTIYQGEYEVKNTNESNAVGSITEEPFNILVTGSDSRVSLNENSRSDVNMLVTINPKTSTILLTSIPRDYYVTTQCDAEDACLLGQLDKLTHTGIHGVNVTKKTVENIFGIDINYTFKVGFESVTAIVDALGGIDVEVAPGYSVASFHTAPQYGVTEGINHLNGEQALAYSRERYAYEEGDRQRVKNQQQVLMAVIDKATSPSIISGYATLMDALSNTFITNMSSSEIRELIQYQLRSMPNWKFEQYVLDGTGSTEYCAELGQAAYVMIPNQNTVATAKRKIDAVINGESSETIQ